MAKLDVPFEQLFKGRKIVSPKGIVLSSNKSGIYIRARPKKSRKGLTPLRMAWVENFKLIATLSKTPDPYAFNMATALAKGTNWYYRDVLETAMSGKLIRYEDEPRVTTPTVHLSRSTAESLVANTPKALTPDQYEWDNNAFWNPSVNPTHMTMKAPGLYLVGANVFGAVSANVHRGIWMVANGVTEIANTQDAGGAADIWRQNVVGVWYFHANDYVELYAASSSGAQTVQIHDWWAVAITPEALL